MTPSLPAKNEEDEEGMGTEGMGTEPDPYGVSVKTVVVVLAVAYVAWLVLFLSYSL
jgi:hypothetical protein